MGTFGTEFVDAATFVLGGRTVNAPFAFPDDGERWMDFTSDLNGVIESPGTGLRFTGGYLYFSPGNYFLTSGIVIWPKMTVIFAPGAIVTMPDIVLHRDHDDFVTRVFETSMHIQGGIQAGLHQIIAPTVVDGVSNIRAGLLFETDTIREVYPEWWGAGSLDGVHPNGIDSHAAIQSAIDAAIHSKRYGMAIPIKLTGRYQISAPLRIGNGEARPLFPAETERRPFVLRGQSGAQLSGPATLAPHRTFCTVARRGDECTFTGSLPDATLEESSLLIVRGPSGFLIEDIVFSGSENIPAGRALVRNAMGALVPAPTSVEVGKVFSCLRLERQSRESADAQMSRVRRCGFRGALGVLVQIGEFSHPYRVNSMPLTILNGGGGQDLLGMVFESCKFSHESTIAPPVANFSEDIRRVVWDDNVSSVDWLRDGVYLRANQTLRLHFIDCFWRGQMRVGIRTYSGSIAITNCAFHLTRMPVPREVCLAQDGRYGDAMSSLEDRARRFSGTGDFMGSTGLPGGDVEKFTDARDNGCDIYVEYFTPVRDRQGALVVQPSGGVTVNGAESQSWRFLATYPQTARTDVSGFPSYDCYIQDAHISNATDALAPMSAIEMERGLLVIAPPGVEWLGPFSLGSCITVSGLQAANGAQKRGRPEGSNQFYTPWSNRVIIGQFIQRSPRVVNLGARTGAGFSAVSNSGVSENDPNAQVFYMIAMGGMMGNPSQPTPLSFQPWYLNLQVAPGSSSRR